MHEKFLIQAINLAAANADNCDGGPFGALIVKDNQVIASSANKVTRNLDPTAHAEILAIREACLVLNDFQLTGCVLYSSCEPCPMCLGAIYWSRLAQVYFTSSRNDAAAAGFDDSFIYDEINLVPGSRRISMHQVSLPDSLIPFQRWQENPGKIAY